MRSCSEFRVTAEVAAKYKPGATLPVTLFAVGQKVDVQGTSIGKGFAGTIKRHNFKSQRASHGNSRSHNVPGSISMAQDPGRVFPGKKMIGHMGDDTVTTQNLDIIRIDEARQLLLVRGAVPGAKNGHVVVRPAVKAAAKKGAELMQLELLNEQGQATSKFDAPDTVFARDYNEALVHQIVVAFQANARQGTRAQKDRGDVKHSTKKPFRQKGTGRARAGMTSSPLWRGGGRIFPNTPDENFSHKVNKKMYRAGMAAILSQLARDGRLAVVDSLIVDSPKTKLLAAEVQGHGPGLGAGDRRPGRRQPGAGLAQPGQRAGRRAALRRSAVAGVLQEGAGDQGRDRAAQGDVRMSTPSRNSTKAG